MTISANKSAAYDDVVSRARQFLALAASTAGSGGTFGRFIAPANLTVYGIACSQTTAGTSTYTVVNTGVAGSITTNTITAATIYNCFRISGTNTTTFGTAGVVSAAVANPANYYSLQTGGLNVLPGDTMYCVNGTDATAVSIPMWDISFTPVTGAFAA